MLSGRSTEGSRSEVPGRGLADRPVNLNGLLICSTGPLAGRLGSSVDRESEVWVVRVGVGVGSLSEWMWTMVISSVVRVDWSGDDRSGVKGLPAGL